MLYEHRSNAPRKVSTHDGDGPLRAAAIRTSQRTRWWGQSSRRYERHTSAYGPLGDYRPPSILHEGTSAENLGSGGLLSPVRKAPLIAIRSIHLRDFEGDLKSPQYPRSVHRGRGLNNRGKR